MVGHSEREVTEKILTPPLRSMINNRMLNMKSEMTSLNNLYLFSLVVKSFGFECFLPATAYLSLG
jgi:hypothetical protein